ncbi:hypothetical protein DYQ93_11645 [Xanthomonas sp. LMG 8992]|uniref:hypothetical protein n=1 Tax=Xanthomonas sp. LMG 8992 TaxID=1591157 RepID=UPI00136DE34C|nr:hypothetical protein [Xanthomonas sp. LMG 8992]MXV11674.1 hypothetical protein [Xanthomonas sp. LMG 8992]
MADIQQLARELLASEYEKAGEKLFARRAREGRYDNDPDMRALVAALNSQLQVAEDVRREAERYQWLKRNCVRAWESDMAHNLGAPSLDIAFDAPGHDLDSAIDTAMAAASSPEVR